MGAPERQISEEYLTKNPPVIPCQMAIRGKFGNRASGKTTQVGWQGYRIFMDEEIQDWKCKPDNNFTLTILADGYCEIPATKKNLAKLELACKPQKKYALKMKKTVDSATGEEIEVVDRDEKGKLQYTSKVIGEEPAMFRKLSAMRQFNPKKDVDVDMVRPWLRQFVQVPEAIMNEVG